MTIEQIKNLVASPDYDFLRTNRNDIQSLSVPEGPIIDRVLNHLLNKVIDNEIANEYDALMEEAKYYVAEGLHWQFR